MTCKCNSCGYVWEPRIPNPVSCPRCCAYRFEKDEDGRRIYLGEKKKSKKVTK